MKLKKHLNLLVLGILAISSGVLVSCHALYEDLPECRLFVKFKYDYNMLSVDAFHKQVDKVELYVFDKDGKFLFSQTEEGVPLTTGEYLMEVEVPFGDYKFMAWAGAHGSYEAPALSVGTSITEAKMKLKRPSSLIVDTELEPLWYGESIDVNFTGKKNQVEVINLIRDTNRLTFIFQSVSIHGWGIKLEDYTYEIIEANGHLGYDNSVLADDVLSYQPYYANQLSPEAVKVELNTMRLMEGVKTRFVVTEKKTGERVFDICLTDYLAMTLSSGSSWGIQEYFDRQWEWDIVFFLSDSWIATQIKINDWTWYSQTEN